MFAFPRMCPCEPFLCLYCLAILIFGFSRFSTTANLPLTDLPLMSETPEFIAFLWWSIRDLNSLPYKSNVFLNLANMLFYYVFELSAFAKNPHLSCQPLIKPLMQFFTYAIQNRCCRFRLFIVFVVVVVCIHVDAMT